MLVLSRKVKQSVTVGDDIKIVITQVNGGSVKIAIDAPQNVRILRSELESFQTEEQDAK